eukprot:gnl/MRDRNA2_/MRDRNA2_109784_c0_seq1.p1 gnl/MRDRNA2_/MRDRNA2_109784_c0~~gnl/MRDRNA2_/MRDRNA2_109784_c0_seq1.p1  ORF type:complete len:655 (+),score=129.02 gnl/MRDRNA2_/MRDRNA2_109784_c0_seq1:282-1967(+)
MIEAESRPTGFAVGEAAKLDASESMQFLVAAGLLGIFAMAVKSVEEKPQKQESHVEKSKMVQLLRIDAIATRLSCAAGLMGVLKIEGTEVPMLLLIALAAICNILPASRQKLHEVTGVSPVVLGLMPLVLFMTTALYFCHEALGTALVHSVPKIEAAVPTLPAKVVPTGPSASNQLMLLLVAATCLINILPQSRQFLHEVTGISPVALGLTPLVAFLTAAIPQMVEADRSPRNFMEAKLDVPQGVQSLLIAALLGVFSAAVRSSEEDEPSTEGTKKRRLVNLVKADRIALRLACAATIIGFAQLAPSQKTTMSTLTGINQFLSRGSEKGFGNSGVSMDVSAGVQLITAAALIFIFKIAINDANEDSKPGDEKVEKKKFEMVNISAIALRLSCAAMVVGCLKLAAGDSSSADPAPWSGAASLKEAAVSSFETLSRYFPKSEAFGRTESVLEVSVGMQILVLAVLLFTFKLAIDDAEKPDTKAASEKSKKPKVQLVDASRIALRLAVGAGTVGICKTLSPVLAHCGNVLWGSKELLAQGSMLGAATGFVMWSSYKQKLNVKAC